ncbi:hypothetical protein ACOSP7_023308 [Xanthoceras sorbifolium]
MNGSINIKLKEANGRGSPNRKQRQHSRKGSRSPYSSYTIKLAKKKTGPRNHISHWEHTSIMNKLVSSKPNPPKYNTQKPKIICVKLRKTGNNEVIEAYHTTERDIRDTLIQTNHSQLLATPQSVKNRLEVPMTNGTEDGSRKMPTDKNFYRLKPTMDSPPHKKLDFGRKLDFPKRFPPLMQPKIRGGTRTRRIKRSHPITTTN